MTGAPAPPLSLTESVGGEVMAAASFKISPGVANVQSGDRNSQHPVLASLTRGGVGWGQENSRWKEEAGPGREACLLGPPWRPLRGSLSSSRAHFTGRRVKSHQVPDCSAQRPQNDIKPKLPEASWGKGKPVPD